MGSFALRAIKDGKRWSTIEVNSQMLNFHTLVVGSLFSEHQEALGVYATSYSLEELSIKRRELVMAHPDL